MPPHNWAHSQPTHVPAPLRTATLNRDGGQCTAPMHDGSRCAETTKLEVDHIINVANGGMTVLDNLQTLCHWHHDAKTQKEARAARRPNTARRPTERHPGLR